MRYKAKAMKRAAPNPATSASGSTSNESIAPSFLILDPSKGTNLDILKFLVGKDVKSNFLRSSDQEGFKVKDQRWMILISFIICRIFIFLSKPIECMGYVIDFFLNLLSQNDGVFGILWHLLHGSLKIPQRDTGNFLSLFGQVDGRIELYKNTILSEKVDNYVATDVANIKDDLGDKYLMDLCIMASKFAYENPTVIQNVVDDYWKMHFVAFYSCWNETQQQSSTQVFIFNDKQKDADLIVVSFRGTECFNAQDLCIDFDFSWFEIPNVGKVHIGFLEAMGLGNKGDPSSFQSHLQKNQTDFFHLKGESEAKVKDFATKTAYYAVALALKDLLIEHKNAKFVVTGHSLGGALAILFPSVLVIQEETEMLQRLLNVYTFGQPRIGDSKFGAFIEAHLNYPTTKYFRVVYCYDMIPRVPFHNKLFSYKHFGTCIYYDSCYFGKYMEEEPNKNYFDMIYMIPMLVNAQWELFRSMIIKYVCGPDYKETWLMTLFRVIGLVLPYLPSHSPVEYTNSVRLGRDKSVLSHPFTSLKRFVGKF